jgi:hypothetical protein
MIVWSYCNSLESVFLIICDIHRVNINYYLDILYNSIITFVNKTLMLALKSNIIIIATNYIYLFMCNNVPYYTTKKVSQFLKN